MRGSRGKSTGVLLAPAPNHTMKKQSHERNPACFKRATSPRFFFFCKISLKSSEEFLFLNSCSNLVNRCERWSKVKKQVTPAKFDKSGTGADPGFFLGGGALVSCSTSTPINHIVFFLQNTNCIRKPQVISGEGAHPPAPSPKIRPWGNETREDSPYNRCNRLITGGVGRWMPYFMILFLEKRENLAKATWKCGNSESKFNLISGRLQALEGSGI